MKRTATAHWEGNLLNGKGEISTQSGIINHTPYSFKTRVEEVKGTNPEELIAAAHAGCFTMALTAGLSDAGHLAVDLNTKATVDLDLKELAITGIHLELKASRIAGLDADVFISFANNAKANCIISKALNVPVTLDITYA